MARRTKTESNPNPPDDVLDGLLGQGLGYRDWETSLQDQNFASGRNVRKILIKRELEYFKEEILLLTSQPNTSLERPDVAKTNSCESVLKRLKGETWVEGRPNERDQRYWNGRLLGGDAK
jgi:hypothetical protein